MRTATITIEGVSPYSAGRVFDFEDTKKQKGESFDDHEKRCWRQRLNVDAQGRGIIPPMAFALAIQEAAARFGGKIEGKGNTTWKKYFEAGILVTEPLILPVTRETVQYEMLFVPSDGVKGSGKRVWKNFPIVHQWGGDVTVYVVDDNITKQIFATVAEAAFKLVGVGRFRPQRGGFYGRAAVKEIKWS